MSRTIADPTPSTASPRTRGTPPWAMTDGDFDDARRYAYTEGWDVEDAELGWVDADVVSRPRRLH